MKKKAEETQIKFTTGQVNNYEGEKPIQQKKEKEKKKKKRGEKPYSDIM